MNTRYSALIQLVDYVEDARHVAVGDLLCVKGEWSEVTRVDRSDYPSTTHHAHVRREWGEECVSIWKSNPVARIPGPLLALLSHAGDPYR